METFGQYAATRPLREHPVAPREAGGVLTAEGIIRTFMGVDLVTGMPVIVYTMPAPAPRFAEVYSEHLPAILERGENDGVGYVVVASAPGYAPLRPTLPEPRLHWLARCSVKTLFDAHAVGLVHTHLHPEHFYAQGDHLFIEGFGLPWADEPSPYRAPEGTGQPPADVFAWARCMNTFGKGDPSKLIDGELGRLIGHCLNLKPRERPTAGELVLALEQILNPKTMGVALDDSDGILDVPELTSEAVTVKVQPAQVQPAQVQPAPLQSETQAKTVQHAPRPETAPPIPVIAQMLENAPSARTSPTPPEHEPLPVPEGLEADEPDVVVRVKPRPAPVESIEDDTPEIAQTTYIRLPPREPVLEPTLDAPEPSDHSNRDVLSTQIDEPEPQSTIRIGWSDDDSWRPVRAPTPPGLSGPPLLVLGLGALLTLALLGGLVWFLRGNPNTPSAPSANPTVTVPSIMTFQLDPPTGRSGRLTVISAPAGANLKPDAVLATVPGPVLFTAPGTYRLRVTIDGYETAEIKLEIPSANNTVILKLPQR